MTGQCRVDHDRSRRWVVLKRLVVGTAGLGAVGGMMDDAFTYQDHVLAGVLVRQTILTLG